MRVHIIWPTAFAFLAAILVATTLYQRSSISEYGEAEPLYPTVADFGDELAKLRAKQPISGAYIENLLTDDRFAAIQPYGVVFSSDPELIVSIRVNEVFSFDIELDGRPRWNKK